MKRTYILFHLINTQICSKNVRLCFWYGVKIYGYVPVMHIRIHFEWEALFILSFATMCAAVAVAVLTTVCVCANAATFFEWGRGKKIGIDCF